MNSTATPGVPPVEVRDVWHRFVTAEGELLVLDGINLSVRSGRTLAIVGPSGCGKTTLLNMIAGLESPQEGSVTVMGSMPVDRRSQVGYLFARDALLPWRTALENVTLGMRLRGIARHERRERARHLLAAVGLEGYEDAYRSQLSQGMRQRVALARTLALEPDLLLMDEPFSALDAQTRLDIQEMFLELLEAAGTTVVLITHDLAEAVALGDDVAVFTRRPGRLKATFAIDLPRPRKIRDLQADPRFHAHYSEIWEELRDEFTAARIA